MDLYTNYTTIPHEMVIKAHWVCFNSQKEPINPKTGRGAQSNNPATWATFDEAKAYAEKNGLGMGFMLGTVAQRSGVVGVDVDHCRNSETGELSPLAREVLALFPGCYAEISPSGTGLHILAFGQLPAGCRHKKKVRPRWSRHTI